MLSISDILSVLDNIPIWKNLKELPTRVDALEKRITQLEEQLKKPQVAPAGQNCRKCGSVNYRMVKSEPDKRFGRMGGIREYFECDDCHFTDENLRVPK